MMGFQDGLVSISGLVYSLAAAKTNVLTPSILAALAAAISMGLGEFTSVSSARDAGEGTTEKPWRASVQSFVAFLGGALIPIAVVHLTGSYRVMVVASAVAMYLASMVSNTHAERNTFLIVVALFLSRVFGTLLQ